MFGVVFLLEGLWLLEDLPVQMVKFYLNCVLIYIYSYVYYKFHLGR